MFTYVSIVIPIDSWFAGIIIQPYLNELDEGEFRMYFSNGIFIKSVLTAPNKNDEKNQFEPFHYVDISKHHDPFSHSMLGPLYQTFIECEHFFIEFGTKVISTLNIVPYCAIIQVDLTIQTLDHSDVEKNKKKTYPYSINSKEVVTSEKTKIRFVLNEVTTTYDIQFASTTHNFPLVQTFSSNVAKQIDASIKYKSSRTELKIEIERSTSNLRSIKMRSIRTIEHIINIAMPYIHLYMHIILLAACKKVKKPKQI
jgi:hypothetical protein